MIEKLKSYALWIILVETFVIVALVSIIQRGCSVDRHGTILPSDKTISRETVTSQAPLVGLNKAQLREKKAIPKDVAQNPDKAVLASGTIKDDSGSRTVSSVLDTKSGETEQIEKRPIVETMKRFELGLGYGFESGDLAKAVQFRATLGRIGNVYFTGQAEYFDVQRSENRHPWNAMGFVTLRF